MATKKTKNAKNAAEYIDSAGVKLNANSDLIIEANKDGDVISARNLINGNEYVGGGSGGGVFKVILLQTAGTGNWVANKTFSEIIAHIENDEYVYACITDVDLNTTVLTLNAYNRTDGENGFIYFSNISATAGTNPDEITGIEATIAFISSDNSVEVSRPSRNF